MSVFVNVYNRSFRYPRKFFLVLFASALIWHPSKDIFSVLFIAFLSWIVELGIEVSVVFFPPVVEHLIWCMLLVECVMGCRERLVTVL
jgi:hypothetical protein